MADIYQSEITVHDVADLVLAELSSHRFQSTSLTTLDPLDRWSLDRRDKRDGPLFGRFTAVEQWRASDDYALITNGEDTTVYVRPHPAAPRVVGALPFELHFSTAAPNGYSVSQYYSLVIPQRNLNLLAQTLRHRGHPATSFISDMHGFGVLTRLPTEVDVVTDAAHPLPVHVFHSMYVSRRYAQQNVGAEREQAIMDIAKAISSLIIAQHLYSRKQVAYYQAAAAVDDQFLASALVG